MIGLGDIGSLAMGALVIVSGLFMAWFAGRSKGSAQAKAAEDRAKEKDEIAAATVQKNQAATDLQVKLTVESNEIDEDVKRLSNDDLFNELRNGPGAANRPSGR